MARPPRPRLLADLTPLRVSRDFRLLFTGNAVSYLGRQLTVVAIPFQVFTITGSSLAVGMIGLATIVPLVTLSLAGGAIADAVDRRKLLLVTQLLSAATSAGLALNASSSSPRLWPIYVLAALSAGLAGVDLPARNAVIPRLVGRELFPSAAALGQIQFQVGQVAGPALAGVIISQVSLAAAYWIDVASFGAAVVAVLLIAPQPPEGGGTRASLSSVAEGLRYVKGRRLLLSTFLIDIDAMVFGMPRALFPALGTGFFGGGAATVGLLYAAPGRRRAHRRPVHRLGRTGPPAGAGGDHRRHRVGRRHRRVRARPMAPTRPVPAGPGRRRRCRLRRLPQHHPPAVGARRAAGPAFVGAYRGGDGWASAGRRRGRRGGRLDVAPVSVVSGGVACILGVALVRWVPDLARYDAVAETRRSDG